MDENISLPVFLKDDQDYYPDHGTPDSVIRIYDACRNGHCSCSFYLDGKKVDLFPCRFGSLLYGKETVPYIDDVTRGVLWSGISRGFSIVDDADIPHYRCENYKSILSPEAYSKMCNIE